VRLVDGERGESGEGRLGVNEGRRRIAAEAARRVERVDAKELVHEAASDSHHGGAAVLALDVELVRLDLGVIVADPAISANVAAVAVRGLRDDGERLRSVAGLTREGNRQDLQPAELRDGLERGEAARRHVRELELSRAREVAREADTRLNVDDVEEGKHGRTAVLDLHDLVAAHVLGLDEAERVVHAERRQHADVTLLEHGGADRAHGRLERRRLEGGRLDGKSSNHSCWSIVLKDVDFWANFDLLAPILGQ